METVYPDSPEKSSKKGKKPPSKSTRKEEDPKKSLPRGCRIPEEEIELIKREVDLVALVRAQGVELKRQGKDLKGHCPFHNDKNASLIISPHKNLWHCMGACQKGGTVIDWVMEAENVSFRHAVELLREKHPSLFRQHSKSKIPQ